MISSYASIVRTISAAAMLSAAAASVAQNTAEKILVGDTSEAARCGRCVGACAVQWHKLM